MKGLEWIEGKDKNISKKEISSSQFEKLELGWMHVDEWSSPPALNWNVLICNNCFLFTSPCRFPSMRESFRRLLNWHF